MEVFNGKRMEFIGDAIKGWFQEDFFFSVWLFSCDIHIEECVLLEPGVVQCLGFCWEVVFEGFVSLKEGTYYWSSNLSMLYLLIHETLIACVKSVNLIIPRPPCDV